MPLDADALIGELLSPGDERKETYVRIGMIITTEGRRQDAHQRAGSTD